MARVLFSTFGSAGDLFPLLPIARLLRDDGHEVSFAVPRVLGLYLRTTAFPTASVGDGSELRVADDPAIFTTRFSGWASHRRTFVDYIAPTLADDVAKMGRIVGRVVPDVVVTMNYAVAARIAALSAGVPHVGCTIYPQFARLAEPSVRSFARPFLRQVVAVTPADVLARSGLGPVAWGVDPAGIVLHDPVLLGPDGPAGAAGADGADGGVGAAEPVGYPYWDDIPGRPDDVSAAHAWLDEGDDDVVLVTLGSFIGAAANDIWADVATAMGQTGMRALVVNARAQLLPPAYRGTHELLAVGFVPLSGLLDRVVGVVHHGGLGTTFATLRAGKPAVVVPQAFDQPHVGRLVEAAGVGVVATGPTLADGLRALRDRPGLSSAATVAAAALVPAEVAARRAADHVVRHAGGDTS